MDVTIYQGHRESTYRAFLHPILGRENLIVSRYSRVIKVCTYVFESIQSDICNHIELRKLSNIYVI